MESPLNEKIQRELRRKAAKKKNDSNYVPVLSLRDQVLELVYETNKSLPVGRKVTPRNALIVMDRAKSELASLSKESFNYGVLREVSRFISLSSSTIRHNDFSARHTDLLAAGHPLSPINASLGEDELRVVYANWLAADPRVDASARSLVAAAYSAEPGSVERKHAFMRLRSLTAGLVPNYVKIEHFPITAAFGSGNSSAARRARVALQWRDKKGRWVEMGRGANFNYTMPDGSMGSSSGTYVGVAPDGRNGLIQVSGDRNLADGIYQVAPGNVETFSARIPQEALKKAGIKRTAPRQVFGTPSLESIKDSRLDAPTGWTKVEDPSRIDTYTSDDNYTARVKVFPVGNRPTEYVLYRQNEDGSLGEKVGDATNWADINDLANKDSEAYDQVKGEVVARVVSPESAQARMESNARLDELEKIADSGNDERGNPLPAGWDAVIRPGSLEQRDGRRIGNQQVVQNEAPPTITYEKVAAEVPGRPDKPYVISARMMEDGRLLSEGIWDSWEALDAGIPERVNAEGKRIQAKLEPISYGGADSNLENYIVDFETLGSSDMFEDIPGLEDEDPTEMTDEESIAKWLEAKGLDKLGVKAVRFEKDGLTPRVEFEIPTSAKEAFSKAYGLSLDENLGDGVDKAGSSTRDKEIFDRRMAGESLDKVAKDYGLTRQQVRKIESDYMKQSGSEGDSDYLPEPNPETPYPHEALPKNSVSRPKNGQEFVFNLEDVDQAEFDEMVKDANSLGIYVEPIDFDEAPKYGYEGYNQGGDFYRVVFPGKVDMEMARKFIGATDGKGGFNSAGDGVFRARFTDSVELDTTEQMYDALINGYPSLMLTPEDDGAPGDNKAFDYNAAKKTALDEDKTGQERYAAVFDGARGDKFVAAELGRLKVNVRDIPKNTEVVFTDGDGQVLTLRFPDGSYHILDTGALDKDNLVSSQNVNDFSAEVNSEFLSGLFEPDGLPYYRGGFIDQDRQSVLQSEGASRSGGNKDFSGRFDEVKKLADSNAAAEEFFNALFKDAEYATPDDEDQQKYNIPADAKIYFTDMDNALVQYSDGTWHDHSSEGYETPAEDAVYDYFKDALLKNTGDAPIVFYYGSFVDGNLQNKMAEGRDNLPIEIDDDGPDEPPTPPSGGTPPKTPSPNVPSAPGLFSGFNVPDGAFKFNTVSYEPEGRVDEASRDFTDDPSALATKFTPQDLVQALSQALLGNSSDAALAEILNANVDDSNDILDPADIQDSVNIPQVNLGVPSGAGQLEFSAGAEFVPAEALFNAIWEAGLDPNRVVANIYDSVNGNNNNLNKLIEAQGGVPSQEETQLVEDIVQEIRQLKEVSDPGDSPVANEKQTPSRDPLPGSLIENIPIDFENPDYYIPNPEAYIPSQPDVDENGYTDNPEIISADYEVADLIEQMLSGITDGSGAALLAFDNITVEVPIEAMRDAIQYQDINTNQILLDLKKESNDMSEPSVRSDSPTLQAHSELIRDLIEQAGGTVDDDTADKIRDAINQEGLLDWSEAEDAEIIEAIAEVAGPGILSKSPAQPAARRLPPTTGQRQAPETPADSADTPRDPSVDEPMPNASTTRVLPYPGPENRGYHPDNTTLDVVGKVMGYGSRIRASRDGATGTVIAVQNIDSRSGDRIPYVRVLFDDGRIAVRSALKVRVTDQDAQRVAPVEQVPERPRPLPDVSGRLDAENPSTGIVATDGSIRGVNSLGTIPEELADLTNPNARQVDFAQWGERAGEIARAGRERVTLENIRQAANDLQIALIELREMPNGSEKDNKQKEYVSAAKKFELMVTDAFGIRDGVTFGRNEYYLQQGGTRPGVSGTVEQIKDGKQGISLDQSFNILDKNGSTVGTGGRTITLKFNTDGTSYWTVKNNTLSIPKAKDKKSGFATAYNRFMEDWYIANGVREIHVYAAGGERWQGGFVWALNGFNWDGPDRAESQLTYSLSRLRRMASSDAERNNIDYLLKKFNDAKAGGRIDLNKVPTPLEIALVGWYPGAKEWIGKEHMISTTWEGVKRLDPKAKEQVQALNYNQMRAARKRLESKENKADVSREFSLAVNSNEFENNNVELQPHLEDIRDVFANNRSMAVLSPAAKTALSRFISNELLKKKEDRQVPFNDILQLRRVLDAEYAADYPNTLPKDFGVGKDLTSATLTQIETNTIPGFTVRRLGHDESGYNSTYLVTHNDSGQTFYLKEDQLAENYSINPVRTEVEAGILVRGLGLRGGYETRGNNNNESILVMQQAGASLALYGNPQIAYQVFNDGAIISSDDTVLRFDTKEEFVDHLASPEDAVRITLLDLLINNQDRHNGNILIAVDAADSRKLRLLPIDHSLAGLGRSTKFDFNFEDVLDPGGSDNIYNRTMPVLTKRMSQDELLTIFRNEADRLRSELKNESLLPTGTELALIEQEWGSISNYRDAINARLDMLLSPNGEMLPDMMDILKPGYWT